MFPNTRKCKLIPLLKMKEIDVDDALRVVEALEEAGVPFLEVIFRRHTDSRAIREIANRFPDFWVGAGNILNRDQLLRAIDARARFAMSPGVCPETMKESAVRRITFVPGAATTSDILNILKNGLVYFQYFPAETNGGPEHLQHIIEPFDHLPIDIIARGGITPEKMLSYLKIPQVAAVTVDWIVTQDYIERKRWDLITEAARRALAITSETELG